jgi:hypothetical protein
MTNIQASGQLNGLGSIPIADPKSGINLPLAALVLMDVSKQLVFQKN